MVEHRTTTWDDLVKRTIARFARNVAARQGRILLPHEQEQQRANAVAIARKWKDRASRTGRFCRRRQSREAAL